MEDFSEMIRKAGTGGPNFGLDTEGIVAQLKEWQKVCAFRVVSAEGDRVEVEFDSLPTDMEAFVRGLYKFCPDLVDQGTGCVHEYVEMMEESGGEIPAEMKKLTPSTGLR